MAGTDVLIGQKSNFKLLIGQYFNFKHLIGWFEKIAGPDVGFWFGFICCLYFVHLYCFELHIHFCFICH